MRIGSAALCGTNAHKSILHSDLNPKIPTLNTQMRELVKDLLLKSAREQRASNGAKLATDSMRVGRVSYVRSGMSVNEYWERGAMW